MSKDEGLKIQLMKVKNFVIRRFKNHDRLYWNSASEKLKITGNLRCHVEEIDDPELRDHILNHCIFLN